jgi:phosphomannomutase
MLRLFAILVRKRASMDDLLAAVPRKHVSCEIRIPCDDLHKESIVSKVGDQFHLEGWTISKVDGIRAQHAKGWGLLRASHTQPAVSFRCEADTERDVAMIKDKFSQALKMHIHADIIDQYLL